MVTKLYLAEITINVTPYMEASYEEKVTRLVWAIDDEEAEALVKSEYENGDPYGINRRVSWVELTEALGSR